MSETNPQAPPAAPRKPMTRKRRRMYAVAIALLLLGASAALVLNALEDSLVFFHSPTQIIERDVLPGQRIRVGGLVEEESVSRLEDGTSVMFRVTDLTNTVPVIFGGALPDLFREGQGVVAEGTLDEDGIFQASEVLAKHDENYMPPEVAEALKKSGRWEESEGKNIEGKSVGEITP